MNAIILKCQIFHIYNVKQKGEIPNSKIASYLKLRLQIKSGYPPILNNLKTSNINRMEWKQGGILTFYFNPRTGSSEARSNQENEKCQGLTPSIIVSF